MDKRMSDEVRRTGVIASGIAMLAMLLAGGCGSSADTTDMAQAGRMPAPAEVAGSAVANELPGSATGTGQEGGAEQAVSLEADTSTIPHIEIDLDAALREIAALEAPADVDAQVFAELKAELGRLLKQSDTAEGEPLRSMTDTSESDAFDLDTDYFDGYMSRALLTFNEADSSIEASYNSAADYDRNGIVSAADLVPLARNFGYPVGNPALGNLDGDGNGVIGLGDLVPIARHMGQATTRMYLFGSLDLADYPWEGVPSTDLTPLAELQVSAAKRNGKSGQIESFRFTIDDPQPGVYYWASTDTAVRPSRIDINRFNTGHVNISQLRYDRDAGLVMWNMYQYCDWDRSFWVSAGTDITGFSILWQEHFYAAEDEWRRSMDLNRDGHVGMADFSCLEFHQNIAVPAVNFYISGDANEPSAEMKHDDDLSPIASLESLSTSLYGFQGFNSDLTVNLAQQIAQGEIIDAYTNKYLWHAAELPDLPSGVWVWIRPVVSFYGSEGPFLGEPSEAFQIP